MKKIDYIKTNKYSAEISINGEIVSNINLEALLKSGLKVGNALDDDINNLIAYSEKLNAKKFLLASIARNQKSEREARMKLHQKGFTKHAVDFALDFAKKYDYINDEKFAHFFAQIGYQSKGEHRIRHELRLKGISDNLIEKALEKFSEGQCETASRFAGKYMLGKEINLKNIDKLYKFLMSRGYDYEIVMPIINKYRKDE